MFTWEDWEFYGVSTDLQLGDGYPQRPPSWNKGIKSIEATVQTLLEFHLQAMTGLPLRLLFRPAAIESSADLVATDSLGRVHLFELKKGPVNEQAASQLETYLLRQVFVDAASFLTEARRRGRNQFTDFEVAKSILGVHANDRPEGFGQSLVGHIDPEDPLAQDPAGHDFTDTLWERLSETEKLTRFHLGLMSKERSNKSTHLPDLDEVETAAAVWGRRLRAGLEPPQMGMVVDRPLVIWLVGASVTSEALERIRLWRRAGVDARALCVTARMRDQSWTVGVRRECAPSRDRAEAEWLLDSANGGSGTPVKALVYNEVSPSKHRRHGGEVLENPWLKPLD